MRLWATEIGSWWCCYGFTIYNYLWNKVIRINGYRYINNWYYNNSKKPKGQKIDKKNIKVDTSRTKTNMNAKKNLEWWHSITWKKQEPEKKTGTERNFLG